MSFRILGDFTIAEAGTQEGIWITGFGDLTSLAISARLAMGSGGETIAVVIQTSLNKGLSVIDIARFNFTTTGIEQVVNLTSGKAIETPWTVVPLAEPGTNNGIIGDMIRAVVISTGIYSGPTVISVRADGKKN